MTHRLRHTLCAILSCGAVLFATVRPALATGDYAEAVAHTERMAQYYEQAKAAVEKAQEDLEAAEAAYAAAEIVYKIKEYTVSPEASAMRAAHRALTLARAALSAATVTLELAAAALVGVAGGTAMHQLGAGAWDLCWDPLCDLNYVQPGSTFVPATEAEIEAALPALLMKLDGVQLAESSFVGPARVVWDYMVLGGRFYLDTTRGAASYNSGDYEGLFEASDSLEAEILAIPGVMAQVANALDTEPVFPESVYVEGECAVDIATALADGVAALDWVLAVAEMPADESDTCQVSLGGAGCDSTELVEAATAMRAALQVALDVALSGDLHDSFGVPRRWGDFAAKGTRAQFQAFVAAAQANGVAALPPWEIYAGDTLLSIAGVHTPSEGSIGPAMAAYDAGADGEEEAAIFDGQPDSVGLSRVLRVSATTLSPNGRWLGYRMDESPVWVSAPEAPTPTANRILGVRPNPARSGLPSRLLLTVSAPSTVDVGLFDVAGRKVGSLTERAERPGPMMLTLDEASLGRLARGMYLLRMSVNGLQVDQGKVLFVAP